MARRQFRDPIDLALRIDRAGRIVGVGEDEDFRAGGEGRLQCRKVEARPFAAPEIVHRDRHDLAAEKLHQLAIGEIVRLDDRDLVASGDGCSHRQKQRSLRAGRDDDAVIGRNGCASEDLKPLRQLGTDVG